MICCIKTTVFASPSDFFCPNGFYFTEYSLKAYIILCESKSIFHEYKAILKAQLKRLWINNFVLLIMKNAQLRTLFHTLLHGDIDDLLYYIILSSCFAFFFCSQIYCWSMVVKTVFFIIIWVLFIWYLSYCNPMTPREDQKSSGSPRRTSD